jgi:hypothetical protein
MNGEINAFQDKHKLMQLLATKIALQNIHKEILLRDKEESQ